MEKSPGGRMKSIRENNTWTVVEPPNNKSIGSKWVLRKKLKLGRSIDKLKKKLLAKDLKKKV